MSDKRKHNGLSETEDNKKKWAQYRENAGKALKERLHPTVPKNPLTKTKHTNFITTRMVEYDGKKKRYQTLEDKQCVEIMGELEFQHVSDCVWTYYEKKLGYSRSQYTLKLITGISGPVVSNTAQLDNKKDLFVLFEPKNLTRLSVSNYPIPVQTKFSMDSGSSRASVTAQGLGGHCNKVPKSVFPQLTPSAILSAGRIIRTEHVVEKGLVRRFIRTTEGWAWLPGFEIKFCPGAIVGSGSFRQARSIQIIDYGELPLGEYLLKTWNKEAIEGRQFELGDTAGTNVAEDLTRRGVQCQIVAQRLAEALAASADTQYGVTLRYITSYYLEWGDTAGSIELKLDGNFVKYLNNTMDEVLVLDEYGLKAASLSHFSLIYSAGATLLTDLQGCQEKLTDPEIASLNRYNENDQSLNFGFGNFGADSIQNFKQFHECNCYCRLLGLVPFEESK